MRHQCIFLNHLFTDRGTSKWFMHKSFTDRGTSKWPIGELDMRFDIIKRQHLFLVWKTGWELCGGFGKYDIFSLLDDAFLCKDIGIPKG